MEATGILLKFLVTMGTLIGPTTSNALEAACNGKVVIDKQESVQVDVSISAATSHKDCVMSMHTARGWRIVVSVDYRPSTVFSASINCAYSPYYLMVGNDYTAIGHELMTSYKYCRDVTRSEVVSRDYRMWAVLRDSASHPSRVQLTVRTLPEVACGDEEMECSPVQCVDRSRVCDGTPDCSNGHDEYCYHLANVSTTVVELANTAHQTDSQLSSEEKKAPESSALSGDVSNQGTQLLHQNNVPPEGSTCFLCRDGTCILPRVERYDWRWGAWLWYLCDGINHCPDGWDENGYMCVMFKHYPGRFEKDLFTCEAYDLPSSLTRQVRMWSLARCDGRRDCRQEGLEGEDMCQAPGSSASRGLGFQLHMSATNLASVLVFCIIVIVCALIVFRKLRNGRQSCDDLEAPYAQLPRPAQPTVAPAPELKSCVATRPMTTASKEKGEKEKEQKEKELFFSCNDVEVGKDDKDDHLTESTV